MRTTILATWNPPAFTIRLRGEFDLATQQLLRWRFADATKLGCTTVRVDAGDVTYIDCGSLQVLADAAERLAADGGELAVVQASSPFGLVAEAAGFGCLRPVEPTAPGATPPGRTRLTLLPARSDEESPAQR